MATSAGVARLGPRIVVAAVAAAMAVLGAVPDVASAGEPDARAHADRDAAGEPGPELESFELRFGWLEQDGRGWQSRAGVRGEPGSERLSILQPMALFRLRTPSGMRHTVVLPVDIVTSASADALDAVSSASYRNEAGSLDVTSELDRGPMTWRIRWGGHFEEPLRTAIWGGGFTRRLAEDNATVSLDGVATYDYFDNIDQWGITDQQRSRVSATLSLGGSQILSPTTLLDGGYGFTYQVGTLEQTWNAVPREGRGPLGEKFPHSRARHALMGRVAQHLPATRTTLKLAYRFYTDDFGLTAHSTELRAYQWLGRTLLVRGHVRWHTQSGVDFYTESFVHGGPMDTPLAPRTSDSDLAPLDSWELGARLTLDGRKSRWRALRGHRFAVGFDWYERSNGLQVQHLAFEWAREL